MKPFATRFLILCGAFIGLGVFATTAAAAAPTGGHPKGPLLYVQQTSGGSIVRVGPGAYRLRLTGVSPRVTTFTDRPRRRAGSQGIEGFVHKWGANGFGADPPNAALVSDHAPASRDVALLTLSHPRYDRATQTLTYRVAPLHGRDPALASFAGRADPLSAGELGSASLFVDDGGGDPDTITVNPDTITVDFQHAELTTTSLQIIIDGGGAFCLGRTTALSMAGNISFDALYVTSDAMTFSVQSGTTFNASVEIPVESQGSATLAVTNFAGTVTVTWPTDTGLETQTMMSGDPITLSGLAT